MAASPKYKLFRGGAYIGSMKDPADAACCAFSGIADDIRISHEKRHSVWETSFLDYDSYDAAASAMLEKETQLQKQHHERSYPREK